jgi:signal transduction histidine kinase
MVESKTLIPDGTSDLRVLLEITVKLLETVEKRKMLEKIMEGALQLIGLDTGAIYILRDDDLYLDVTLPPLAKNFPDEFRKAKLENHPHIKEAIRTKSSLLVNDITTEDLSSEERLILNSRRMRSLLYIPLLSMQKVAGMMIIGTIDRKYKFSQREIDLCHTLSNIGSLALENSLLFEQLNSYIGELKTSKELAEESDRLKTAFLHNISHEIRTPLNAIVGFSTFLNDPDLPEDKRKMYYDIIVSSNDQLLSIIDGIMRISHLETGQVILNEADTSIRKLTDSLYNQFRPAAEGKQLGFIYDSGNINEDTLIKTDAGKLKQILSNLLDNAFKFTHKGYVGFECRKDGDYLEFLVRDTGIGIPEEEHDRIFERFYQVDKSKSQVYGGTGLGLSICAGYATMLGGSLDVKSKPGSGSVFTFRLHC